MRTRFKPLASLIAIAASLASAHGIAAPIQWQLANGGNGHWYEYVAFAPDASLSWHEARSDAASRSHAGNQGHLLTIGSVKEFSFVLGSLLNWQNPTVWAGASDAASEGQWAWTDGPEAGQVFSGPGATPGAYTFWNPGEPNNAGSAEDYLAINWAGGNGWNDVDASFPVLGYVVEYSPVPVPGTLALGGLAALALGFGRRRR
ncbi:MAG: lectin-like protein [Moraxellaceae bacterium]|nr:lectin-like protein [Moraxellaceae bacterium]